MLTFALSWVIGGLLSDRYGRRPTLLWSMPIFLVGSVVCLLAGNMTMLVMGRLLQGLGVGISALSGPALITDCFEGEEVNKVSGYYSTVYSFIPISAPVIGGILQDLLGWRANFGFMLLLGIVVFDCLSDLIGVACSGDLYPVKHYGADLYRDVGGGLCFPHLYADAVSAVTEYAGIAGALIGSLILTGAVIITAIVTRLHAHSPVAMAGVFLLLSVLAGVVVLVNRYQ